MLKFGCATPEGSLPSLSTAGSQRDMQEPGVGPRLDNPGPDLLPTHTVDVGGRQTLELETE